MTRFRNVRQVRAPDVAVREPIVVHSYKRGTGELVEVILNEFCWFVVHRDGKLIHQEARSKHQGPHTPRTAKTRALEYEKQDHAEFNRPT